MKHIPILKNGGFGSNILNAGLNLGKAYIDYNLSGLGLGDVIPDSAYKGNTGQFFGNATNITGQIGKAVLPAAANVLLPGSGAAVSAGQNALGKFNKPLGRYADKTTAPPGPSIENQTIEQPMYMGDASLGATYRAYKTGGLPDDEGGEDEVMVNVEKGELEVDPMTCKVLREFNDIPKHPKGKDMINLKGNVSMKKTNVIIPAKHREKYMSADKKTRMILIKEIVANAEKTSKKEDGGMAQMPVEETNLVLSPKLDKKVNQAYYDQGVASTNLGNQPQGDFMTQGAVGAAASIPGLIFGMNQTKRSKEALAELQKQPLPKYTVTPEQLGAQQRAGQSYARAQGLALGGYTPAEKAAYQQNLAKSNATTLYNARNTAGGQSAAAINGALGSQSINNLLNFAQSDAALNRQNIRYADQAGQYLDQTGQQITNQKNLQTNLDVQRRMMQEQNLGRALSEGRTNTANSAGQLAGNAALIASQFL